MGFSLSQSIWEVQSLNIAEILLLGCSNPTINQSINQSKLLWWNVPVVCSWLVHVYKKSLLHSAVSKWAFCYLLSDNFILWVFKNEMYNKLYSSDNTKIYDFIVLFQGLKKLVISIETSYTNIQKLVINHLQV